MTSNQSFHGCNIGQWQHFLHRFSHTGFSAFIPIRCCTEETFSESQRCFFWAVRKPCLAFTRGGLGAAQLRFHTPRLFVRGLPPSQMSLPLPLSLGTKSEPDNYNEVSNYHWFLIIRVFVFSFAEGSWWQWKFWWEWNKGDQYDILGGFSRVHTFPSLH